ncbi:glycoside hydrolase family 95 protein [Sistotremastrum niveocremeum HHB9708]|uniref:Glycoside hydrolase family 95 protein n=1 Tax=Sistotremastrum niveocremeum HHB9708 TaxID=1314777 RepID=A0A164VGP4_9AGAM|nr:glycoside hydrolase family 95 protein [Sistotremastrum niveocremeum HHB9708]
MISTYACWPWIWDVRLWDAFWMFPVRKLYALFGLLTFCVASPPAFPSSGNGLWYAHPGTTADWIVDGLVIGNGYLGATVISDPANDLIGLNLESLWTGGPFQDPTYNGGNPDPSLKASIATSLTNYRRGIFGASNGMIPQIGSLMAAAGAYGSFTGAGYLGLQRTGNVAAANYYRWLDLDQGVLFATWSEGSSTINRTYFCSNPDQSCIFHTQSSTSDYAGIITFSPLQGQTPVPTQSCLDSATLQWRGTTAVSRGGTGMIYEVLARIQTVPAGLTSCSTSGGKTTISFSGVSEVTVVLVGNTDYSMDAGNVANDFSFKGADPHDALVSILPPATQSNIFATLLSSHQADYALLNNFTLNIGQTPDFSNPTDVLISNYSDKTGNPYLEWVLFNFGRYLLFSSARGTLPANLQGKWGPTITCPWGADYHANINLQMNYWAALSTNMPVDVTQSLFNYMEQTWAPRGAISASTIYNISRGWVTHDEMNIFGHTGMKDGAAQWANYPQSAAWMMVHVWDQFDYMNNLTWLRAQGYPLLKGVAQFHLDLLVPDQKFNDGTLVTAPCNSPEQSPITLGCSHAQQVSFQLFSATLKAYSTAGDHDPLFLAELTSALMTLDPGLHIGSWGQLQEWKVDMDKQGDTHRHLSHLFGLYPGYSIPSYVEGTTKYTEEQLLGAATVTLISRGDGTGPDGDAGWEKVWRAAAWAQLGYGDKFYNELTYSIFENFGPNLLSNYNKGAIFQIDANLGYPAAVMNALIQAPDVPTYSQTLVITLLPALPPAWPTGSIKNARIRGGISVMMEWTGGGVTSATFSMDDNVISRPVQIKSGAAVMDFTSASGQVVTFRP